MSAEDIVVDPYALVKSDTPWILAVQMPSPHRLGVPLGSMSPSLWISLLNAQSFPLVNDQRLSSSSFQATAWSFMQGAPLRALAINESLIVHKAKQSIAHLRVRPRQTMIQQSGYCDSHWILDASIIGTKKA